MARWGPGNWFQFKVAFYVAVFVCLNTIQNRKFPIVHLFSLVKVDVVIPVVVVAVHYQNDAIRSAETAINL